MEMQSEAGHGPTTTTAASAETATTFASESTETAAATESATFTLTARDFHCRVAETAPQHELWQPFINCEATLGYNSNSNGYNNNNTLTTTFQCTLQTFDRHEQKALYACNDTELEELASASAASNSSSFTSCPLETHILRPPHEAYAQFQLAVSDNVSDTLSFSANRCNAGQMLLCKQAEQETALLCQLQLQQQQQEQEQLPATAPTATLLDYRIELADSGSLWSWLNLTELVDTVTVMGNESVSNATAIATSSSSGSGSLDMILSNYTLSDTTLTTTTMASASDIVISRSFLDYTPHGYDWLFLFVVFFIFAGGLGNILVCLAVALDRKLQNVTNYFLFSLAIADLLVSLFVMPMGAIPAFLGK